MSAPDLIDAIRALSPEEQESVRLFVEFLQRRDAEPSPFLNAVDEFVTQHPDLLQRLAQ